MTTRVDDQRELEEKLARMRRQAQEPYPESFVFSDEEAEFIGYLRSVKPWDQGDFGRTWIAVFEELLTGKLRSIFLNHAVLRNEMAQAGPRPGELVVIRYHGRVETEGPGQPYALYRVVVDRPDADIDWSEVSPEVAVRRQHENPGPDPVRQALDESEYAPARAGEDDEIPF